MNLESTWAKTHPIKYSKFCSICHEQQKYNFLVDFSPKNSFEFAQTILVLFFLDTSIRHVLVCFACLLSPLAVTVGSKSVLPEDGDKKTADRNAQTGSSCSYLQRDKSSL